MKIKIQFTAEFEPSYGSPSPNRVREELDAALYNGMLAEEFFRKDVKVEVSDLEIVNETQDGPLVVQSADGATPLRDCAQEKAFRVFLAGSALAGSANNSNANVGFLVEQAFRLADEALRRL